MTLWCSQSGDHSENNLVKFGYILDTKKKNLRKESLYILGYWLWTEILSQKSGDLKNKIKSMSK
jgi:hypothetical protein